MHRYYIILAQLHAGAQRRENKLRLTRYNKNNEDGRRNSENNSTISISRHHVANLSLETLTIRNRHHIRIIFKHAINSLPASYMIRHDALFIIISSGQNDSMKNTVNHCLLSTTVTRKKECSTIVLENRSINLETQLRDSIQYQSSQT